MESLYSLTEEQFAKILLSTVSLDQHILALAKITKIVQASDIPKPLHPSIIIRVLRILQDLEIKQGYKTYPTCYTQVIPHPNCGKRGFTIGEMWNLPYEDEWICFKCGEPVYDIYTEKKP